MPAAEPFAEPAAEPIAVLGPVSKLWLDRRDEVLDDAEDDEAFDDLGAAIAAAAACPRVPQHRGPFENPSRVYELAIIF